MKHLIYSPGEPAGIGPDLILKLSSTNFWESLKSKIVVMGDIDLFRDRSKALDLNIHINEIKDFKKIKPNKRKSLQVFHASKCLDTTPSKLNPKNSKYVLEILDQSIKKCVQNKSFGLVTGPINKANIIDGGHSFSGHTERLMKKTKSKDVLMMLASSKMRVCLVTTHIPINQVAKNINKKLLMRKIIILNDELKDKFKIKNPKIFTLGLNPHAGENGHIGDEETRIINPCIKEAQSMGINISAPMAADTAFSKKNLKTYDAFLAMYHDQALPVIKSMSFGKIVNVSLGLPIVRTSVDHGTALELSGTGNIKLDSLKEAFTVASKMIG